MLKSIFNWRVLLNLLLAIALFVGLVFLTFRWLDYHTQHGKEMQVPNLVNKSVFEATKVLDDIGMEYEVDSFKFDPKYRPYQVLKISPTPGSRVKAGRTITLLVNPRTWAKVSVPDIIDRYKGTAFQQLERTGLAVGDTIYEPSIQKDAVIRMMLNGTVIKPGTMLPRFTKLDVVIGSGPLRNIVVPNVVGMTVGEAKAVIARALFEVGVIDYEEGTGGDEEYVYYQDPAGSAVRDQGMQIDLWASKKIPAQMQNKIKQLDNIYRIKIEEDLSPVSFDDYDYNPPAVRAEPPRSAEPAENKPAEKVAAPEKDKSATKPSPEKSPAEKPKKAEQPAAPEKPKRKIIVE